MRLRLSYLLLPLVLLSCSKMEKEDRNGSIASDMKGVEFCVKLPSSPTKAGSVILADRCIVEVYCKRDGKNELCTRKAGTISGGSCRFNLTVGSGPEYSFLFWADCSKNGEDFYYDTSESLEKVQVISSNVGNDERRDAFCANIPGRVFSVDQSAAVFRDTVTLKRPFAQINVITTDSAILQENEIKPLPRSVKMTYKAAGCLNVRTGEIFGEKEFAFEKDLYEQITKSSEGNKTLCMDYILAPDTKKYISNIALEINMEGGDVIRKSFSNIPFERNYRTFITGSILTLTGAFDIRLEEGWRAQ